MSIQRSPKRAAARRRRAAYASVLGKNQVSPVTITDVFGNARVEEPKSKNEVLAMSKKRRKK